MSPVLSRSRRASVTLHCLSGGDIHPLTNREVMHAASMENVSMAYLWSMGYGLWAMGYGLWPMAYGLWPMAYGLWPMAYARLHAKVARSEATVCDTPRHSHH